MTYPKFEYIGCVSPNLFINRTDELSKAVDTVFNRRMNVFVTGPRTIGKTSFLFKLKEMVEERHTPQLFPLVFDLSGMYQDYFSDFLPELVAQLSARVAMQFFDLSYSELYERLKSPRSIASLADVNLRSVLRVYTVVKGTKNVHGV